jgi:hypothetical protein
LHRNDWPVDKGLRPAGDGKHCFYCGAEKGAQHRDGCNMRVRSVVVKVTFEYVRLVPEDWDAHMIEFHLNESSSCADNIIEEISELAERRGCACGLQDAAYVRDASDEDEENCKTFVKDAES